MTPEEQQLIQERQRARARITAIILGGLCVLFFAITIAKMV